MAEQEFSPQGSWIVGSRFRKTTKRYKPVPRSDLQQFRDNLEALEYQEDEFCTVNINLRKIIPLVGADFFRDSSRAVMKAAEQIHARMYVMGLEKRLWHELGIDSLDSYEIAAYDALRAALNEVVEFVEVPVEKHST